MSRYFYSGRSDLSPFASQQDSYHVTDEDFSYITSEDLENSAHSSGRGYDSRPRQTPAAGPEEDDVLLVKNKGITYPIHFPAYSIGDGKLYVKDVRNRVGLVMELNRAQTQRVKMLYKGRQLKEQDVPIRSYGVKNNSEILLVIPEGSLSDEDDSESEEEVIVKDPRDQPQKPKKKKNGKSIKKKKKTVRKPGDSESTLGSNLDVPQEPQSGRSSADPTRNPSRVPSPAVPSGPIEKIDAIRKHFDTELAPLCNEFLADPPADAKKCEDEHRKLSETVLQHVLLKLDEVDTGGDPDIRAKRKALVNYVQGVLQELDKKLPDGVKPTRL